MSHTSHPWPTLYELFCIAEFDTFSTLTSSVATMCAFPLLFEGEGIRAIILTSQTNQSRIASRANSTLPICQGHPNNLNPTRPRRRHPLLVPQPASWSMMVSLAASLVRPGTLRESQSGLLLDLTLPKPNRESLGHSGPWSNLNNSHTLVVNNTSLGMQPPCPIQASILPNSNTSLLNLNTTTQPLSQA